MTRIELLKRMPGSLWHRYFKHSIPSASAELAYNLLFAVFPMIVFIHIMLVRFGFSSTRFLENLSELLPGDVVGVIKYYIGYIDRLPELRSSGIFIGILIMMVVTMIITVNNSSRGIRLAFDITERPGVLHYVWVIAIVFMIILSVVLLVVLNFIGGNFANTLASEVSWISRSLISALKYYILPIYVFIMLTLFYSAASLFRVPLTSCMPGAVFTVIIWCAASYLFSYYVGHFAKYSVFYGSVGSIMVFMIWLFLLANILLIGAEFNAVIFKEKRKKDGSQ